jgi:hypothetical protein
VGGAIVKENLT